MVAQGRLRYPDVDVLAVEHAEIAMGRGDWAEAVGRWVRLLEEFGEEAPVGAYGRLSRAYRALGDVAAAEASLRRGRSRYPDVVGLAVEYAEIAMDSEDWPEAVRRWGSLLEEFGEEAPAGVYGRLSQAYRVLDEPEAAEPTIRTAWSRCPDAVVLATEYAEIAAGRNDWPEAVRRWLAAFDRLGERTPAGAYKGLCQAYRALNDLEAAEATARRGQVRYPEAEGVAAEYAEIAMDREDWAEAVRRWSGAVLDQHRDTTSARTFGQLHLALRSQGDHETADRVFEEYLARKDKIGYSEWIDRNDTLSDRDRALIRDHIASLRHRPTLSLLFAPRESSTGELRQTIESVRDQLYPYWELCVVPDRSTSGETRAILQQYAEIDARIHSASRRSLEGRAACLGTTLSMASGEWAIPIDQGDRLSEHSLYLVAEASNRCPDATIIYSDEDHIDPTGLRTDPISKPDWNYDMLLSQNYLQRLSAYRADLVHSVGGVADELHECEERGLSLRILDAAPGGDVVHIPRILYHRAARNGSPWATEYRSSEGARRAVNNHLWRTAQAANAIAQPKTAQLRIRRDLPEEPPPVSIVIPTRNRCDLLETCVEGLINRTDYRPMEMVIVDNGSSDSDARVLLADLESRSDVTVVEDPRPFNFSRLVNEGVAASSGEVCVLLNNDIDVISSDWLEEMVSHAVRPEIGAVGAKLYYENDTVQHGGVTLGLGTLAGHAHRFYPRHSPGYMNRLSVTHDLSAVTAACLATRRDVYDKVGGFNEDDLPVAFNDVDFCLRVGEAGYRIVWTPYAELYHYESASRRRDTTSEQIARAKRENAYMRTKWGATLDSDPFYSPNLALGTETFDRARTARSPKPWLEFAYVDQ